jgi:phage terminase small subunit
VSLNPRQQRFVEEYLVDLNATQAAIRAGYSEKTAYRQGADLLKKPQIVARIAESQAARSARTEITQDAVLRRWWELANADANDLIQWRHLNCRHCWGADHLFQWTDEAEYRLACARERAEALEEEREAVLPSDAGGYGFDRKREPHADCPRCRGEGHGEPFVQDTRKLKGGARLLYAGIKVTRDGVQVLMRDQDRALENCARHVGLMREQVDLNENVHIGQRLAEARKRTAGE